MGYRKCKCVENDYGNTNFTLNKIYEVNEEIGVRTDCGGMWSHFRNDNRPSKLEPEQSFEFGMCKFKVC